MTTIYPKDYFKQLNNRVNKATCFVLMPFDPKFKEIYDVIKGTLQSEELNIICNRADDFHQPHIIETILKNIVRSEFIIADLTESNANVFYELGLAHCVKDISKVIILTQDMKYVPFDLRQFRCIVYEQSISGAKVLKDELTKTFQEVSSNSFRLRVRENRKIPFGKKLVGRDNNLYEISIEVAHIGYGMVKMIFHFNQISIDKPPQKIESQFLFVSEEDFPTQYLENIPWTVSFVRIMETEKEAIISLDKL